MIAEDLDAAILIAKRFSYSFRIVTLKGDIVNPGGSMTGGSNAVRGISILGRNREIMDLRMEILAKQRILTEMETRYQEHVSIYKNNKNSLEEVEGVLHKLEMMFSSEEEKLDRIILRQSEADKEMSTLLNEKQQIKQDLEELTASISETNEELQLLESKNADINQENKVLEEYMN